MVGLHTLHSLFVCNCSGTYFDNWIGLTRAQTFASPVGTASNGLLSDKVKPLHKEVFTLKLCI